MLSNFKIIVEFGKTLSKDSLNLQAASCSSQSEQEYFFDIVQHLEKEIPWMSFDKITIEKSEEVLEAKLTLTEYDIIEVEIVFRKVDNSSFENMNFRVNNMFGNDIDIAAHRIGSYIQ